ncbi:MAG: RnfABCDGE type electron transport complex subunit G [Bacteroidales bacterium]|nr:RnfABCDGE type electron transport complex subunit G [Bacteroidales bacterium]
MAVKSSFKNMSLCLLVICLACSALLAGVYALTKEPIATAEKAKNEAAIKEVLPSAAVVIEEEKKVEGTDYTYNRAFDEQGNVAGYAINVQPTGFGGPIRMKVGFDADGCIWNVKVLSHSETPGLGAKCTDEGFAVNYGYRGLGYEDIQAGKIKVTKDGGVINAITASTITSRAYAEGVALAVELLEKIGKTADPLIMEE